MLLALMFFGAFIGNAVIIDFIWILIPSLITLTAIGSFGNILNDFGDIESDTRAGKKNIMSGMSYGKRAALIFAALAAAIIPWRFLPADSLSYSLLLLEFFLLIAYPVKPFRLKRFPYVAIIADALYAFSIPAILAFHTYSLGFAFELNTTHYALLFLWTFSIGLRHILYHHVNDRQYDEKSQTPNIALNHSVFSINRFIRFFLLPAEFLFGTVFIFGFFKRDLFSLSIGITILLVFFASRFSVLSSIRKLNLFPEHSIGHYSSDNYYRFWFSFLVAVFLTISVSWHYLFFVIVILVFFSGIKQTAVGSLIFDGFLYGSSYCFNYSIYYFRKYFLNWSEEKNRGIYYKTWLGNKDKRRNGTIAIVNLNFNKYTETFVKAHFEKLPFRCEYYYGVPFPINNVVNGNLISDHKLFRAIKKFYYYLISKKEEEMLLTHFHQKNVSLILAEFGTSAVKVSEISSVSGIPLVVIFYGYDIWNNTVLSANQTVYKQLFETACKLIGVSKEICEQLVRLGCPPEKIEYLPCYVNLELFNYSDHSKNPPIFLAVGRFSETKSPHLTILAFKEVLREMPDAKLIMIGKDGGGELFEACNILAIALGIEKHVEFAGIQSPEKVYEYMKKARVFVQHSLTTPICGDKEGTPVAIMEAMACGLPVVATRHAGIAELIENNTSGILVEEYDYKEMAKAMLRLCNSDDLVFRLGKNAAESIRKNELIVNNIEKLAEIIVCHKLK
jgi:colanic acid/amylovoran biosynthesis glycosyltransferase